MALNGVVSDDVAKAWLAIFTPSWFSLHTSDPMHDGAIESEVVGGSYARQAGVFSTPTARTIWLVTTLTWRGMPEILVTHIGVWRLDVGGMWLSSCALPDGGTKVAQGASFVLQQHTYAIQIGEPA